MKCPRCGSHKITHKIGIAKKLLVDLGYSLAIIPGVLLEKKWNGLIEHCNDCGLEWRKMNW
jgi:hypothetical protein